MRTCKGSLRASGWVLALIVLLPFILYWPFVFGGQVLFWGTPLLQFWPWRQFAADELRAGRLPMWNPYTGNGGPLLADHQSAVLYPLNAVFWFLPVERALGYSLVLHAVLAGLAMYAVARGFQVSRLGAIVAALAFMFSGYAVSRGSFLTEISALPWLPLLWLFGVRAVTRRDVRSVALLAAAVALQFLAGHAQTWFYSLIALALFGLWGAWSAARERRPVDTSQRTPSMPSHMGTATRIAEPFARYALLLLAVLWGVALAGAQFLPTLELSQVAGRTGRSGWEDYALQYSMWPWRLITLLLPDFFGNPVRGDYWGYATYWEDAGYIGVLPFLLALVAIVAWMRWRRLPGTPPSLRCVPILVLLAAFALLMALGKNTPFYMFFFRHVPGFRTFQAPARWLCVYTPAVALLAGIGTDALRPSRRLAFVCRLAIAAGLAIALTTTLAKMLLSGVEATFFDPLIQFALWFIAALLLLLWGQGVRKGRPVRLGRVRLRRAAWQACLILAVTADLILAGYALNPATDASLYAPQTEIGAFLAADGPQGRIFYPADAREAVMFGPYLDFGDYGPTDVAHWWGMREALLPDLGMVEHLSSVNTFEPLAEARYRTLLDAVEEMPPEKAQRVLGMMNVAYILHPASDGEGEIAYRSPSVTVYRQPDPLPRAYVVCVARVVDSPDEALAAVTSPEFDPAQEVILERSSGSRPATLQRQLPACDSEPAVLLPSPPNQAKIRAVLPQPGYLVMADTYYPGWQAFVDGRRVEILRANYAFRAVPLSAGEHEVEFRYRPLSVAVGAGCSAIALLGAVLWWWLAGRTARDA